jgi:alpha-L-rhamnosidase
MMSEIAEILGKEEDAKKYKKLAHAARKAFCHLEVKDGRITSDRQCKYVRPLYMGLLDEEEARRAADDLNQLVVRNGYHLNTGFLTTPYLCKVLADYGYVETAYKLLLQEDTPGWLYAVKKGATTIWESWEGNEGATGVASLNHYSKGAVVSWLFEGVCGIHVKGQRIVIRPQVDASLQYAKATYDSPVGRIQSAWSMENGKVEYCIRIPSNTKAVFVLPDGSAKKLQVGENRFTDGL